MKIVLINITKYGVIMAKLEKLKLGSHPRGDTGVIRWSWKKQTASGTEKLSLAGYKACLTVKSNEYDLSLDDSSPDEQERTTVSGYNNVMWKVDIDCDNPTDMSNIDPREGQIIFPIHKQAAWLEPGKYNIDIVLENKASRNTTTVMFGEIEIQGHPTNRLTTDGPDSPTAK